jgi:iron(III) transport system permease protein
LSCVCRSILWLSFLQGLPGTAGAQLTLSNYVSLYADPFIFGVLANTLGFAVTSLTVGLVFGVAIAWLVERTDLPGRSLVYTTMSLGLLLPNFFVAMGWLFLLHPRIGIINQLLADVTGYTRGPLSITTIVGMGWVQGLSLASLGFILTAATFRAMDPALEEAARVHGASFTDTARSVLLPLLLPGILASALYMFTIGFAAFDVPAIIGLSSREYTFSTFVYSKSVSAAGLPEYGGTAAMSVLMVGLALTASVWYGKVIRDAHRYQVVTGKGYRPRRLPLGRWTLLAWLFLGTFFALSKLIPLLLLVWAAGLPFFQPPSVEALVLLSFNNFRTIPVDLLLRGATNTVVLTAVVPVTVLLFSFGFSWMVVRSRLRFRGVIDFFAFLPHAIPDVVFGVSALFTALFLLKGWPLYGSLTLLAMVYVLVRLSFGTRLLNSVFLQINRELEEAAAVSGATGLRTARRILAPLIMPALLNGWLWMVLLTYKELTLATILYSPSNITLPVVVWNIWINGNYGVAAAISLIVLCCLIPLVVAYWWVAGRRALGPQGASLS